MKNKIIFFALLVIILSFCLIIDFGEENTKIILNVLYSIISAFISAIIVILFLDNFYKAQKEEKLKNFLEKFKLKFYSNLLLLEHPINNFLKCNPSLLASASCKIGRVYCETGEIFDDSNKITRNIKKMVAEINKQKNISISQEKRFEYCVCYCRLYENIKLYLNQICELKIFVPEENFELQEIFLELYCLKQNIERIFNIITKQINYERHNQYSEEEKANSIAFIETMYDLDGFTITEMIFKNIESILNCLQKISQEPEILEQSKLIKKN